MKPVARIGDVHVCPIHGTNIVVSGGSATIDGVAIARVGDMCGCGATIVDGSQSASNDGLPIARVGSKTSHGGVILPASRGKDVLQ